MHPFEYKIKQFIESEHLLSAGNQVIVGLSGGADSVALLSALRSMGYRCVAAHCNFDLRDEEADRDQRHALDTAIRLGAEWRTIKFDTRTYMRTNGLSVEMACRELRYEWFNHLINATGAEAIAVAHHRDDNVETLLLNLLRGAGVHGLRGMKSRNGRIIRPMLNCTRTEVTQYLNDKGLEFVTDSSNLINDVKRNRLRNIVIPLLNEQFPGASEAIAKSVGILRQNELIVNEATSMTLIQYMTENAVNLTALFNQHPVSAEALLFELLYPMGFNATQVHDIVNAHTSGNTGRVFHASDHTALIDRGQLILYRQDAYSDSIEYRITVGPDTQTPIKLKMEHLTPDDFFPERDNNVIYLDAKVLDTQHTWALRHWRKGDSMIPFGMKGHKKLSDIFSDAKFPITKKNEVWLLTCDEKIVWIIGIRTSDLFKITPQTTDIIKITYIPD